MKNVFNMIGGGFQHAYSSCGWEHPKHIEWDKTNHSGNISVHIDDSIFNVPVDKTKLNIAWFCESPFFTKKYSNKFDDILIKEKMLSDFKYIFTNDKEVVEKHKELHYLIPHAFPWVENKFIFDKTKDVSIISSAKNDAPGHKLRHIVVEHYGSLIEQFGGGYKKIKSKNEGLNDFRFSFAIENIKNRGYFTEKIADCFATGTVPIYWGDDEISSYFVEEGIIKLDDDFDILSLNKDLYDSKKSAIEENFNIAINLPLPEDYIFVNYCK
jgi:hypothetical protein